MGDELGHSIVDTYHFSTEYPMKPLERIQSHNFCTLYCQSDACATEILQLSSQSRSVK